MSQQVIILGAGVIGLCTALGCSRRGMKVTIVDPAPQRRDGCSFGNAGMVVPSHFIPLAAPGMMALGFKWMLNPESPFYVHPRLQWDLLSWAYRFWRASTPQKVAKAAPLLRDLALLSRQGFTQLGLEIGLAQKGLLMLCKQPHTLDEEAKVAEKARALGLQAEVLDARATSELDPDVNMSISGSIYFPQDCHLSPSLLMAEMERELRSRGATFLYEHEVTGHSAKVHAGEVKTLKSLHCGAVRLEADFVVLAAGYASFDWGKTLDLHLTMQAGRGYSLTLPEPRQLPEKCSICTEARLAVTPIGSSLRVGGTMELIRKGSPLDPRRVRGIQNAFCDYFPAFETQDFENIQPWSGLRPVSPDGLPYLGKTRAWNNLFIATGHAMMGISLGPVTGQIIADLIEGRKPPVDLEQLDPERYSRR